MTRSAEIEHLNTFGGRLKAARKAKRMTQAELGQKAGLAQSMISEIEKGAYADSARTAQLAHVLGVRAIWLAEGKGMRGEQEAVLAEDEVELISLYRAIDKDTRPALLARARSLIRAIEEEPLPPTPADSTKKSSPSQRSAAHW